MSLHDEFLRIARECKNYDDFREKALTITPDRFKGSVGPHLLEWYVDFRGMVSDDTPVTPQGLMKKEPDIE